MQTMLYVDQFKDRIPRAKIVYYARDSVARAEFDMYLAPSNGQTYPVVNGVMDKTFSLENIYMKYRELRDCFEKKVVPPRSYALRWDAKTIEDKYAAKDGSVSKTKYEAWKKKGEPIGDFQCSYCSFCNHCWQNK